MSFTTPSKRESADGRVRHVGDPVGAVGGVGGQVCGTIAAFFYVVAAAGAAAAFGFCVGLRCTRGYVIVNHDLLTGC